MNTANPASRLHGCLLGLAVGDAIGLPFEGLSRRRVLKLIHGQPLHHRFLFGRGMLSDDTEHACMTVQAFRASKGNTQRFARSLGRRLRWWLVALPAGVGLATLRSIGRLWLGFSPARSGVHSAGNGPCMRAPMLGLLADESTLAEYVTASTRLTHTDPRALNAAMLIARAARFAAESNAAEFEPGSALQRLLELTKGDELRDALVAARSCLEQGASPQEYADRMGFAKGISGYVNQTVPAALYCWLRFHDDYRSCIEAVVALGGDTDTTGAIAGALSGTLLGPDAIPEEWRTRLCDWPRSRTWIARMANNEGETPLFWAAIPWRNVVFLLVVLCHAVRRALPPY